MGQSLPQAAPAEVHEAHLVSSPQRALTVQGQDGCPTKCTHRAQVDSRGTVPPTEPPPTEPPLRLTWGALAGVCLLQCQCSPHEGASGPLRDSAPGRSMEGPSHCADMTAEASRLPAGRLSPAPAPRGGGTPRPTWNDSLIHATTILESLIGTRPQMPPRSEQACRGGDPDGQKG